jgi:hypothetical protein
MTRQKKFYNFSTWSYEQPLKSNKRSKTNKNKDRTNFWTEDHQKRKKENQTLNKKNWERFTNGTA